MKQDYIYRYSWKDADSNYNFRLDMLPVNTAYAITDPLYWYDWTTKPIIDIYEGSVYGLDLEAFEFDKYQFGMSKAPYLTVKFYLDKLGENDLDLILMNDNFKDVAIPYRFNASESGSEVTLNISFGNLFVVSCDFGGLTYKNIFVGTQSNTIGSGFDLTAKSFDVEVQSLEKTILEQIPTEIQH
jgi:hypothetical protein